MFKSFLPDMIGIRAAPDETIELAARHGFVGVDLRVDRDEARIRELGAAALRSAMAERGLRPGYCSILPGKISTDEAQWSARLAELPRLAALAAELGYTRTYAVVLPFHEELPYRACFDMHAARIREAAPILAEYGLRVGLEYVGPVTRRAGKPHEFIHSLAGLIELLDAAGADNFGVMLDSFHWHCEGETAQDIESLGGDRVVVVHINDAVAGRPTDQQVVTERELPGASGVIDLTTFLGALGSVGYDGPVTAEPTHPRWSGSDAEASAAALSAAMDHVLGPHVGAGGRASS